VACGGGGSSTPAQTAPTITTQPTNQTVTAPAPATFTVAAAGNPTPTYQWELGGTAISGATSATYTTPATTMQMSGGLYTCQVTNSAGSVTSSQVTLTVNAAVAGTPALNYTALPAGAFSYSQGTYIESFRFTSTKPISITQLGYYDSNLAGTGETFTATQVGIYDMTTNTLLGQATVSPSDPATTIFRYHALGTPIALNTTDTYCAVAVTGSDYYVSGYNYDGEINSTLTWVSFGGYGSDNLTQTSVLVEPNYFWTTTGNIGPNFMFVVAD
jgi:hypothetical protein